MVKQTDTSAVGSESTPKLRVWHIPNIPGPPFQQEVSSLYEAKQVLFLLARYDLYLGSLIGSNAQGLEVFEDGEWVEWCDEDGHDVNTHFRLHNSPGWEPVVERKWSYSVTFKR